MGNSNLDNLRLNRHDKKQDRKLTSGNLVGPQPKDGEKGIYIQGREGRLFLSMSTLSKGILALGEPGAGKTVLIGQIVDRIINQMTDEDVIIIFDAKGDYQKMFYNCADPRSILISSRESDAENAKGWNIFGEFLDHNGNFGENTEFLAEQMSEMLFAPIKDEKQPFFHEAAMAIFTKVLMGFVENAKKTGDYSLLNNEALKRFYTFGQDSLMERIYSLMKDYPDYTGTIKTYLGMDDNITAQGVLGNIQTLIRRIFTGCFGKKMVAGDFSMRRIIREKGAVKVFLEFDPAHSDALSPGYSALLDVGISEAESIGRGNTYIIVDEAALIPYCKRYSEAPNLGRSQGLKMIVGLQNIHQFVESFGEAKSKSILAGFVNAFCLRSTDADTRRYVCERFGSTDTAGHDAFAIRDADIRALEDGECFVDIAKTSPFRFKPDEHYD